MTISGILFRVISIGILSLAAMNCTNQRSETEPAFDLTRDVKTLCKEVPKKYAYFEDRAQYWAETCKRAAAEAARLKNRKGSLAVLERMIDDLYDPHISFNTHNQNSPRLVPSGSDIWFERINETYVVSAVRPMSGAADAGVAIGDQLVSFNGIDAADLAFTRIHSGRADPNESRLNWAINAAVAGNRVESRQLQIRRRDNLLSFKMSTHEVPLADELISYETISERVGYIRFNNSLGNIDSIRAFNFALDALRETDGLIIDLRETAGGGSTSVAEPIMGRFVREKRAYQRTVFRNGFVNNRKVRPSGTWTYENPVVVLVGRWTGSMGEGLAIGFDGMDRGKVVGSKMAGLAGGMGTIELKETGISLRLPVYDLRHINGTPRHEWEPPEIILADNGNEEDILLKRALLILQ